MLLSGLIILAVIFLLIGVSAFMASSETAITAASHGRMHSLAKEGKKRAQLVVHLINSREKLISAILLGNNLVNILASALATSFFISIFGATGVLYATLIMTVVVVIFGEVLPKTYALAHADRVALISAPLLRGILFIFSPFSNLMRSLARLVIPRAKNSRRLLPVNEEIRGIIDLRHEEGEVVKGDRDMLGGILDLPDIAVSEIMIHRKSIFTINSAQNSKSIIAQMLKAPYTRIPLWKEEPENIVGILHAKDLLRALATGKEQNSIGISQLLHKPWFVPETTTLKEQLSSFLKRKVHFALVVDEYGALMGLITLEDILEEIVGEIHDEHDPLQSADILPHKDGWVDVHGTTTIRDVNRAMGWSLPDEEANTIAGLVIHEAQTIPNMGQVFTLYNIRFTIIDKKRNQITKIRLTPTIKALA